MTLEKYLENKPLFYHEIDYLRMPRAYESIKSHLNLPKIIQIVGTNGKGSTGRFIANMLLSQNISVGHYTSPHIFDFNERIWINGKNSSDEALEAAHKKLQSILSDEFKESLSYFEYTTFLAILIFSQKCDYVVLEAGLGGEYDATSVFPKILSVITPVGHDHHSFLGNSIEEIATTKINSIENVVLLSEQYEECVYDIAKDICANKRAKLFCSQEMICLIKESQIRDIVQNNNLPYFQNLNLKTALCALDILGFNVNFKDIVPSVMLGRCQKISENITIDVGHNIMSAQALKRYFGERKITLIYNSFKDKEYKKILDILSAVVLNVEIMQVENERGMASREIMEICKEKQIECDVFKKIEADRQYLVFGSFLVVEKFLKDYFEK